MKKLLTILAFCTLTILTMPAAAQEYSSPYLKSVYDKCFREVKNEMGFRSVKAVKRAMRSRKRSGSIMAAHSSCVRANY